MPDKVIATDSTTESMLPPVKYTRVSHTATGDCPLCGERPAYPFVVAGIDGYFDSCVACAPDAVDTFVEEEKI